MHFRKILVAVDFSPFTEPVLSTAQNLAKIFESEVKLIHVVENSLFPTALEEVEPFLDPTDFSKITSQLEKLTKEAENKLKDLSTRFEEKNIPVSYTVKTGDIAEEVLETCEEGNFDLLIIGASKYSPSDHTILGNEAEKILNKARASVLVVKKHPLEKINNIVCGYDFLPNSIEALETASQIAKKTNSHLYVVHADTEEDFAHFSHIYETVLKKKIELLDKLEKKLKQEGIKVSTLIKKQPPFEAILDTARQTEASLIVVGKRQRKDIKRFFLGSIAMKTVKNSPVSVLIVRRR